MLRTIKHIIKSIKSVNKSKNLYKKEMVTTITEEQQLQFLKDRELYKKLYGCYPEQLNIFY